LVYLSLVGQPEWQSADGNQRQIDQQLLDVALRIDVVTASGVGQAGKDGRRSSSTRIADKQRVLPIVIGPVIPEPQKMLVFGHNRA
jgi:hypothetical protein